MRNSPSLSRFSSSFRSSFSSRESFRTTLPFYRSSLCRWRKLREITESKGKRGYCGGYRFSHERRSFLSRPRDCSNGTPPTLGTKRKKRFSFSTCPVLWTPWIRKRKRAGWKGRKPLSRKRFRSVRTTVIPSSCFHEKRTKWFHPLRTRNRSFSFCRELPANTPKRWGPTFRKRSDSCRNAPYKYRKSSRRNDYRKIPMRRWPFSLPTGETPKTRRKPRISELLSDCPIRH